MVGIIACLNSKYVHASLSPWCLLAGIREHSKTPVKAKVMEATVNGDIKEFAEKIILNKPDFVALSCYIWNITKTLELAEILKTRLGCTVTLGGPEVSYRSVEVLKNFPFIDFVLSGEGEESLPALLDALYNKKDLTLVSGISFRGESDIVSIPEKAAVGTPPSPYNEEFFENLKGRICYIETSRGCPYSCAFCLSGRCSPLRFFDIDRVKSDIISLANSGSKTVKFVDRTFNAKADRANEILSFILENYGTKIPDGVCFHFEIAGDILTKETLNILKQMPVGAVQLEIGMQSFNEDTLKAINRKTDTKKLIENINTLVSFKNMHIHIDLIAGLPLEDLESFKRSFNIGFNLKANMLQMGFLKLLYGADMREQWDKYPCRFNSSPPYEVTSTPYLSAEEIVSLKNTEDALERLYNSGRFLLTLEYLLKSTKLTPFDIFFSFGNAVSGQNMTLWDYSLEVYGFFKDKCDQKALRDFITADLISCSGSVKIPNEFKIKDVLYKKLKGYFKGKLGSDIKLTILYSQNRIYVVGLNATKDLLGRNKGEFFDITPIIKEISDS